MGPRSSRLNHSGSVKSRRDSLGHSQRSNCALTVGKKLVIAGDSTCGKTSLLDAFTNNEFSGTYFPTIFENYHAEVNIDGELVQLSLWDTPGLGDFNCFRQLCYENADILLLCFSVDDRRSFRNVETKWLTEVEALCPKVPLVLVATKVDLRDGVEQDNESLDPQDKQVTPAEGKMMAAKIGAQMYIECSSMTMDGVRNVLEKAARLTLAGTAIKPRWHRRSFRPQSLQIF